MKLNDIKYVVFVQDDDGIGPYTRLNGFYGSEKEVEVVKDKYKDKVELTVFEVNNAYETKGAK